MNLRTMACSGVGTALMAATPLAAAPAQAEELTKFSYGTNWLAGAEHGGFYQAVADGTYQKYLLDVTIVQAGRTATPAC